MKDRIDGFDWDELLNKVQSGVSADATPAAVEELLQARARLLARVSTEEEAAAGLAVITFTVCGEPYALSGRHILEIARFTAFTAVPGVPPFVLGITNHRGRIVVAMDFRHLMGLAPRGLGDLAWLVIIGESEPEFGLVVDRIHGLATIDASKLRAAPGGTPGPGSEFIRGLSPDGTILLDGDRLLGSGLLHINQQDAPGE